MNENHNTTQLVSIMSRRVGHTHPFAPAVIPNQQGSPPYSAQMYWSLEIRKISNAQDVTAARHDCSNSSTHGITDYITPCCQRNTFKSTYSQLLFLLPVYGFPQMRYVLHY